MTLLVISPDYASLLLPLAALATAWRDPGDRVVVATGPATTAIVDPFGYQPTSGWAAARTRASSAPRNRPAARTTRCAGSSWPPRGG